MKTLNATPQHGFSLIETMVAMIVLALGMLGAVALQFSTAKEQRSSQFVSRAALVANEMAERMRGNRAGLELGFYVTPDTNYAASRDALAPAGAVPALRTCGSQLECPAAVAAEQADIQAWWAAIRQSLPQASAHITLTPQGAASLRRDIIIAWVEPVVDKNANGQPVLIAADSVASGCPVPPAANKIDAPAGVRCYQMRFVL
jgi:type IV pilus assembly protein PilV